MTGSNRRHPPCKGGALPAELITQLVKLYYQLYFKRGFKMADWTRLELATPGVTGRYSNQLNYQST